MNKKIASFIVFVFICNLSFAQIDIKNGNEDPYNTSGLIEDVLLSGGLELLNVDFFGDESGVGVFSNGSTSISLDKGIVLSTGHVTSASLRNGSEYAGAFTSGTLFSDEDLNRISPADQIVDVVKYEIQFIPYDDQISFRYVFASEEYPESVCSNFNDVFGFFITGPNPAGGNYTAENIARVPDPNDLSGNTFLDFPVSINAVNGGEIGSQGADIVYCTPPNGSLDFSQYFNETAPNAFPIYDGVLDAFVARADVIPCETYTIKIAIGDGGDGDFDSAVFLEAKSFNSEQLEVDVITSGKDKIITEACGLAEIKFSLNENTDTGIPLDIKFLSGFPNAAILNEDFQSSVLDLSIDAGTQSASFDIMAIEDNLTEDVEFIYLEYRVNACNLDTIKIALVEDELPDFRLRFDFDMCEGITFTSPIIFLDDFQQEANRVFRSAPNLDIGKGNQIYESTISVNNILPERLSDEVLTQICIDTLAHRYLNDLDIYIRTPDNTILELSTDNGQRVNNDEQVDSLISTCFGVTANNNINNGNAIEGPITPINLSYTGNYRPEGNWSDIFDSEDPLSNGDYSLLIYNDGSDSDGRLFSWSLHFEPRYILQYEWFKENQIFNCNNCTEILDDPRVPTCYSVRVSDNYGCSAVDTMCVNVIPKPEPPENFECLTLSPNEIQLSWDDTDEIEQYKISLLDLDYFYLTGDVGQFNVTGLAHDKNYTFQISSIRQDCESEIATVTCNTNPCLGGNPLLDSIQIINPSCVGSTDGQINVFPSDNTNTLTYYLNSWSSQVPNWVDLNDGQYYLRIVNEEMCGIDTIINLEDPTEINYELEIGDISCDEGSDGSILVTPAGGTPPYTIAWNTGQDDFFIEQLRADIYRATITDSRLCTEIIALTLNNPDTLFFEQINITPNQCFGDADGKIELLAVGGVAPYEHDWEDPNLNDESVVCDLTPGIYNLTLTDARNCQIETAFTIEAAEEIIIDVEVRELNCIENTAQVGVNVLQGTGPFNYIWSNGETGPIAFNLPAGMAQVIATDLLGCEQSVTFNVPLAEAFEIEILTTSPLCSDSDDGSIELLISTSNGEVVLSWDDGFDGFFVDGLQDGVYCVTLEDESNCMIDTCINVIAPNPIDVDFVVTDVSCNGFADGMIEAQMSGGTPPYSYTWSNGQNDSLLMGLSEGLYTLSITDEHNCTSEFSVELGLPDPLEVSSEIELPSCRNPEEGVIFLIPEGGVQPYSVSWSSGQEDLQIDSLVEGAYQYTVTDFNDCVVSGSVDLFIPDNNVDFELLVDEANCNDSFDGSIEVFATGGIGPYSYILNETGSQNLPLFGSLTSDTYVVRVVDTEGCTAEKVVELGIQNDLVLDLGEDLIVPFGSSVSIPSNINNLSGLSFEWSIQGLDELSCTTCTVTQIPVVQHSNIISLTVVDENGCVYEDRLTIFLENNGLNLVEVPTGFSPNGDGANDVLVVYGQDDVEIVSFRVYNRWSVLMYEDLNFVTNQEEMGWDGTFNNEEAISGNYFWIAEFRSFTGELFLKKGSTTLIR